MSYSLYTKSKNPKYDLQGIGQVSTVTGYTYLMKEMKKGDKLMKAFIVDGSTSQPRELAKSIALHLMQRKSKIDPDVLKTMLNLQKMLKKANEWAFVGDTYQLVTDDGRLV